MSRREFYREVLSGKSDGSTNIDLVTKPVPVNALLITNHISAEDETTSYTYLRIGIKRGEEFIPLEEEKSPRGGEVYWTKNYLYFVEHERVCVRFNGTTNGDILKAVVQGEIIYE